MAKILTSKDYLKVILIQLQESFKAIETVISTWQKVCEDSQACVRKVVNLADQLEACNKSNLQNIPTKFPLDIKEKLAFKIQMALEEELIDLNTNLKRLEENLNIIKSECYHANQAYKENSRSLKLSIQLSGTVNRPAITDMIEYINGLQSFFISEYLIRKFSVAKLNYKNKKIVVDLRNSWTEFNLQTMPMHDFHPYVQHFLKEDLT